MFGGSPFWWLYGVNGCDKGGIDNLFTVVDICLALPSIAGVLSMAVLQKKKKPSNTASSRSQHFITIVTRTYSNISL
jgi:hypothetical protein